MRAVPYFFVLKSLAKLAIFNRGRARRCPLARQLPCELTDPGNFGARLLRGRSIGSVLLFGKAKTQSRTRRGAGVAIEVNRWKWAQIDGRGLAVRGETWIDVRCRGVLFSCRVAVAALCAGQRNPARFGLRAGSKTRSKVVQDAAALGARLRELRWKNSAWLATAETIAGWNGFEIRKAGSGRSPVRKRSG